MGCIEPIIDKKKDVKKMETLIVPVYLNQRLVFDLLAMLQGGISTVTTVSQTNATIDNNSISANASFGLGQAFSSLFKIGLSGEKSKSSNTSDESKFFEERIHTPASLFFQLRNILFDMKVLKAMNEENSLEPGNIIEFEASLKRNPILEVMDSLSEIINLVILFDDKSKQQNKANKKNQVSENQKVKKQMEAFSESLKAGNTIDLIAEELNDNYSAVITVETGFLNDPMMSDLVDGKFRVLGKIIRSIDDKSDSISLLRKTALSKMPPNLQKNVIGILSSLGSEQGFDIPELVWEIPGPAIQILPIAIFA